MAATLDRKVVETAAVFEVKCMLPWNVSEEAAAEKHMAQLQHNMWVTACGTAVVSTITGGGKWVEITVSADPLYQHLPLTAEWKFSSTASRLANRLTYLALSPQNPGSRQSDTILCPTC